MGLVTGSAIYFVIWWLTLFMVLPFGVQRDTEVEEGNDPGAPVRARIWTKVAINTVLAGFVWLIIYVIVEFQLITLKDLGITG